MRVCRREGISRGPCAGIASRQGERFDVSGLDSARDEDATVLAVINVLQTLLRELTRISLTKSDSEAQISDTLLWRPFKALMAELVPCFRDPPARVKVDEVDVTAVKVASGNTKHRYADMTVTSRGHHLALFENSLCSAESRQAEHTHQDTVKTRKYAIAECALERALPRIVLGQIGREEPADQPFFEWCHFEALGVEHSGQRGTTFAVLKHARARCSLADLITVSDAVPVLRDETEDTVRAFLLSVLDCCLYIRGCQKECTVTLPSPVRKQAVRVGKESSGKKPAGPSTTQSSRGKATGSQPPQSTPPQSTTGTSEDTHSALSLAMDAGLLLHEPWGPMGSSWVMQMLIGPTMDAALAAGQLRAHAWKAPSGMHSVMFRVAGPPLRTLQPSWGIPAAKPVRPAQLPVLKMVAPHKAAYLRRELRALAQLYGLACVVQPSALVRCRDFAGGILMPHHPPYPVAACCRDGDTFVAFVSLVMDAVIALHRRGVAHGDLKPDAFRTDDEFAAWPGVDAAAPGTPLQLPPLRLMDFNMSAPADQAPPYGRGDDADCMCSSSSCCCCSPGDSSSDGRPRDRNAVPMVSWGTLPFCLVSEPQPKASALDCLALSSLLAYWLGFPAEVGGPDCDRGPNVFERARAVRRLLKQWTAEGTRPVWHLKILVLELLLLERGGAHHALDRVQALETMWELWRNVFWLESSAQLVLLGLDTAPWPQFQQSAAQLQGLQVCRCAYRVPVRTHPRPVLRVCNRWRSGPF